MNVISSEKIPIFNWCNNPEEGALLQSYNLANLPFAFHHIALMPDTHMGYGMPIGGVCATKNTIVPGMVGVDIGCGMLAVQTNISEWTQDQLKELMGNIRKRIPVGKNHNTNPNIMPFSKKEIWDTFIINEEYTSATYQLGTLGSGNHFIEIQTDGNTLWFMLHSGSRNLGFKVAHHYATIAKMLNDKWSSSVPKEWDLAFLPADTKEGQNYLKEMELCLMFAESNRNIMSQVIQEELSLVFPSFNTINEYNIHHNYASLEHHYGHNVFVHRKGATSAKLGQIGIIPGSQGTCSYIVEGLGNPKSFMSCSHGAGRKMSRTKAKETLNLESEQKLMDDKGIIHSIRHITDLDEASSAYKDIDVVMEEQSDLVKIITKLNPLAVIKG